MTRLLLALFALTALGCASLPFGEPLQTFEKVYSRSECLGPIVNGRCHGAILPNQAHHPRCHGQWVNGQCTGPVF
jgi:hypothetical protein